MRDSDKSSSYQRSRHKTKSKSRDRERTRERSRDRERTRERSRDRERYHDRDRERSSRDKDRDYDRDYYSSRHYKSKSKKSKHSKKSRHRRRSSSDSSTSSSSSRGSRSSRISKYSNSRVSKTRAPSSESNSRSTTSNAVCLPKTVDLMDFKVQKALETIEEDTFVPRAFFSTRDREAPEKNCAPSNKVIIDLQTETVTFAMSLEKLKDANSKEELLNPSFLGDSEQRQDKWVRKFFLYRQKYMTE